MLVGYNQYAMYTNVVQNEVLFPVLMEVIRHKVIVLVILAFI
jgi:hypothetical protein